jgi:hypothetical protein
MQSLFGTGGLDAYAWFGCLLVGVGVFVAVELEKYALSRLRPAYR